MHQDLTRAVLDSIGEPVFVIDTAGTYVTVFGGSDRARYHKPHFLVGRTLHEVLPTTLADRFLALVHKAITTGETVSHTYSMSAETVGIADAEGPDGVQWFEARISPVQAADGVCDRVVWTAYNITRYSTLIATKEAEGRVYRELANKDALTGLHNRRAFFAEGNEMVHRFCFGALTTASVLMIDIDHFKSVNDNHGHETGDKVLISLAADITEQLRDNDFVGRLGGEEFGVLLPGAPYERAVEIAERIRAAAEALSHREGLVPITVSIGVTTCATADSRINDSLKRADDALYEAKRSGRNAVVGRRAPAVQPPADKTPSREAPSPEVLPQQT